MVLLPNSDPADFRFSFFFSGQVFLNGPELGVAMLSVLENRSIVIFVLITESNGIEIFRRDRS